MKIEKIFIIHFEPLVDRRKYLEMELPKLNLDYEFIVSNQESDSKLDFTKFIDHKKLKQGVNNSIISVSIKHFEIYQKMIDQNLENCLILEDDAVITENFIDKLGLILDELQHLDYDFCFISSGCNLISNNVNEQKKLYESNSTRTVSGYIVKNKNLNRIIKTIPFYGAIDWHLNWIKDELNLKFYWAEPPIIIHGSQDIYNSNIR
jgi:GR25 family glycosyltransferase involved in LPS biosynthesis